MVITESFNVPSGDPGLFAWSNLRRFWNVDFVCERICDLHSLPKGQHSNARKQAQHIRFVLMLAREYAEAAERVTQITKPVLLYYSIMHLALAEILFKQSGDSSLDRARDQNAHHGLDFILQPSSGGHRGLAAAASTLRAKPIIKNSKPFGTFGMWHYSSREMPISGKATEHHAGGGSTSRHAHILGVDDEPPAPVPASGYTLLEVLQRMPAMMEPLTMYAVVPQLVRGRVETDAWPNRSRLTVMIQPTIARLVDDFIGNCLFDANAVDRISYQPISTGGQITINYSPEFGPIRFRIPHGSMWRESEARFSTGIEPLNEFGLYYLALFMVSNYARYYPDAWIAEVDTSSDLALAIEEMMRSAEVRIPLLALSELMRLQYVVKE